MSIRLPDRLPYIPEVDMLRPFLIGGLFAVSACAEAPTAESNDPLDFSDDATVIDFGLSGDSSWFSVNDTVMGGVSTGELSYTDEALVFEGVVSTDSNGGFTSVRSETDSTDLSDYDRVVIRMRSEGQPFTVGLSHNRLFTQGQFRHDLEAGTGEWEVREVPLSDFELVNFSGGSPSPTDERMQAEDREEIFYMELMSELFVDGAFRLEVDLIAFD
ncbi:MAG: NADH dehydrogenase [ubiquinone] 1 alpha subcomplex assembly factor 1 [Myxococcota bacterium]